MTRLCLCLNQVAWIRHQNQQAEPDPVAFAVAAEIAGVDGILAYLRDDRSDITDRDVRVLKEVVQTHLNIAIPLNDEMVKKMITLLPDMVTLLPSTNSKSPVADEALNISDNFEYVEDVIAALHANKIVASALIQPDIQQVRSAARVGLDYVQFNTLPLSKIEDLGTLNDQLELLKSVALASYKLGLGVSAGRGLYYQTIRELADISFIEELNIGRSIIARSLTVGVEKAIAQLKALL